MRLSPRRRFLVQSNDVLLKGSAIDSPNPAPADLYRRQIARAHKGIRLGNAHIQIDRHILKREELGLYNGSRARNLISHNSNDSSIKAFEPAFSRVYRRLT